MSSLNSIDDLLPNPKNPRTIKSKATKGLRKSLEKYGDLSGITFNKKTGRLVCGHQRLAQLKKIGGEYRDGAIWTSDASFPVRVVDWSEKIEREANAAANNEEIQGDWSSDIEGFLRDIKMGMPEEEFSELQFDALAESLKIDFSVPGEITEDEVPEPPKNPVTKEGNIWRLGEHTVVCGDCCVDESYGDTVAQMIFTDPPYGVDYTGGAKKRERLADDNIGTDIYGRALPLMAAHSDKKAPLYLWYADGHAAAAAAAAAGFQIVAQIIWAKNHAQFVTSAHYKGKHEPCYYAKKKDGARWHGPNNEVTLWEYPRSARNDFHPTQKPVAIASRAISNSSERGGIVLDGFLGSGTTLIAAEQLNRKCYGVEISPAYCDVVVERWQELTGGKATRES